MQEYGENAIVGKLYLERIEQMHIQGKSPSNMT
jgi:hypothetical protein